MLLLAVVAELAVLTSCQLLPLTVESSLCSIKRENDCECYEDKIRINKAQYIFFVSYPFLPTIVGLLQGKTRRQASS